MRASTAIGSSHRARHASDGRIVSALAASLVAACGGSGDGGGSAPAPPPTAAPAPAPAPAPPATATLRVSPATPFAVGCNGAQAGTLYRNAEVEPTLAVNPSNPGNVVAAWQQDRWSNGGSQGIVDAVSFDGGTTWTTHAYPFSRCAGGTAANGGDFDRASNAWLAFSPNGVAHQLALAFTGVVLAAGSESAMLVTRSTDGGVTWGPTTTLIRDGAAFFDDKGSISADPNDPRYVYATWDRLTTQSSGPTMFARSVDNGASWSAAAPIYDPGPHSQTIGNVIVVLPNGTVVDLFTRIDFATDGSTADMTLDVIRSTDHGATWSAPVKVADLLAVGTFDPQTHGPIRDAAVLGEIAADTLGDLAVVWQDARFSNGAHDAIAFARSTNGGLTWTAPVAINGAPNVAAFVPVLAIRTDGTIGVMYDDFRDDTADPTTLPTDLWLTRSTDGGHTWTESRLAGPFDLDAAPLTTSGYFLGDYQALGATPNRFVSLFTVANGGDAANPTDIASASPAQIAAAASVARPAPAGRIARVACPCRRGGDGGGPGPSPVARAWSMNVATHARLATRGVAERGREPSSGRG